MSRTIDDTAGVFKTLGDSARLKILKLIASKGSVLCVGYIAHTLGISQPAVSQHIKTLKNSGLLQGKRSGYHIHHSIEVALYLLPETTLAALFTHPNPVAASLAALSTGSVLMLPGAIAFPLGGGVSPQRSAPRRYRRVHRLTYETKEGEVAVITGRTPKGHVCAPMRSER